MSQKATIEYLTQRVKDLEAELAQYRARDSLKNTSFYLNLDNIDRYLNG